MYSLRLLLQEARGLLLALEVQGSGPIGDSEEMGQGKEDLLCVHENRWFGMGEAGGLLLLG